MILKMFAAMAHKESARPQGRALLKERGELSLVLISIIAALCVGTAHAVAEEFFLVHACTVFFAVFELLSAVHKVIFQKLYVLFGAENSLDVFEHFSTLVVASLAAFGLVLFSCSLAVGLALQAQSLKLAFLVLAQVDAFEGVEGRWAGGTFAEGALLVVVACCGRIVGLLCRSVEGEGSCKGHDSCCNNFVVHL